MEHIHFGDSIGTDSRTGKRIQKRGSGYHTKTEARETVRKLVE